MADEEPDRALAELDAKLRELRAARPADRDETDPGPRLNFGSGLQAGIELLAGVAFGVGVGWFIDSWLGTKPFGLIVMFFLGSAAGVLNAWRYLKRLNADGAGPGSTR
jgi:ATP synthase protein I